VKGGEKQASGQGLDDRVTNRNGFLAVAASTLQEKPRKDGKIIKPSNRLSAPGAGTSRPNNRLSLRQAMNDDIQKAADQKPKRRGDA
jgi:hypothetical protein